MDSCQPSLYQTSTYAWLSFWTSMLSLKSLYNCLIAALARSTKFLTWAGKRDSRSESITEPTLTGKLCAKSAATMPGRVRCARRDSKRLTWSSTARATWWQEGNSAWSETQLWKRSHSSSFRLAAVRRNTLWWELCWCLLSLRFTFC